MISLPTRRKSGEMTMETKKDELELYFEERERNDPDFRNEWNKDKFEYETILATLNSEENKDLLGK